MIKVLINQHIKNGDIIVMKNEYKLVPKKEITNLKKEVKDLKKALIHRRIPSVNIEKFKIKISAKNFTVDFPEDAFYLEGIQFIKRGILSDQQKFFPNIEKTMFTETFIKEKITPPTVEDSQEQENDSKDT